MSLRMSQMPTLPRFRKVMGNSTLMAPRPTKAKAKVEVEGEVEQAEVVERVFLEGQQHSVAFQITR